MNSLILNFSMQAIVSIERIHLFVLTFHQFVCFFFHLMDFVMSVLRARQTRTQHSISRVDSERRIIFRKKNRNAKLENKINLIG